jgi:hypothetical protein
MVEKSDNGAVFVEIGAWFGKSTNYLSKKIKESNKNIQFTTIDTWKGTDDETYHKDVVALHSGDIFYEFIDNTIIANNYGDFKYIKDTSKNAANHFELNSIDFIMIDAGHSYDDVICDLNNWYYKIKSGGYISGDDYTTFSGVKDAVNDFFYSQFELRNCSFFRRKPRIQIKHLLSVPNDMREIVSKSSIEQLKKYGISYEQHINTPYDGMAPYEHCRRPGHISKDNIPGEIRDSPGLGMITGRHYGCYLAHINALKSIDDENYDYTLIFESDAYIYTGLHEFVDIINKACFISERDDVYYISLSNNQSSLDKIRIDSLFSNAPHQTLAHAYLIPNRTKSWWMDRIVDSEWDVADLWYNHVFCHHPKNRYTTNKIYCMQSDGISLLDNNFKKWNT